MNNILSFKKFFESNKAFNQEIKINQNVVIYPLEEDSNKIIIEAPSFYVEIVLDGETGYLQYTIYEEDVINTWYESTSSDIIRDLTPHCRLVGYKNKFYLLTNNKDHFFFTDGSNIFHQIYKRYQGKDYYQKAGEIWVPPENGNSAADY